MTYRELVYMCLDEIKLASDDSYITEDHILFLISKYRAFLLRQKYDKINLPASESNYQKIKVSVDTVIPDIMGIAKPRVYKGGEGATKLPYTFVTPNRFEFVGKNRILQPVSYCTINDENKLEFIAPPTVGTSINVYAIFADCIKASELDASSGDILDMECPIESELVSGVQELVVKDALGIAYRPKDIFNNGNDDLAQLGTAAAASKKRE